jgi:hypothetical protein
MKKKLLITALLFFVGWSIGMLYKPIYKPQENNISHCNWISKYDFYDYEEAVLKEGDKDKLHDILKECGVERFPYMIVVYDVYHGNVCRDLELYYSLMQKELRSRNIAANAPLREFVENVLTEYAEEGDEKGMRALDYFLKDEKGK